MQKFKRGFTLAEVLITLGIIGVVAAITLPTLITNINERRNSERQANIAQKVTQAMETMRAHGLLNTQYASTEAFVDELQKYLKISKRCDKDHLTDCWPTEKITMADGEELEVSKAKTGKHLSLDTETNNVGLILADGAPIILNYNPEAPAIDVGDNVKWVSGLPQYTTTVTGAIDFVMDVNGSRSPNSEAATANKDIRSFKRAKFSEGGPDCSKYPNSIAVDGVGCVVDVGRVYSWDRAIEKCEEKGMTLPDLDTLRLIYDSNTDGLPYGAANPYWSSTVYQNLNSKAWNKYFSSGAENTSEKNMGYANAMCVGN